MRYCSSTSASSIMILFFYYSIYWALISLYTSWTSTSTRLIDSECIDCEDISLRFYSLYSFLFVFSSSASFASSVIANYASLSFISYDYTSWRKSSSLFAIGKIFFLYYFNIMNFRSHILQILPWILSPVLSCVDWGNMRDLSRQSLQYFMAQNSHCTGFFT